MKLVPAKVNLDIISELGVNTYFLLCNQAFSPNEPAKPGEVLSRQNIPFAIGEIRSSLPTTHQELVQRYQVGCGL